MPLPNLFALLDCNSFFASCEKLFRPDLANRPVVVLSNNDGVVVARSPEAKKLGIPMGEPYFKIQRLAEHGRVAVFSSNYRLYGDMSARVMRLLHRWTPKVEIYSIDEAFLDLGGLGIDRASLGSFSEDISKTVKQWTGIPVSLGLGPTLTLAKIANDLAKKEGRPACELLDPDRRRLALADLEIGEVWGVGRRLAPKMRRLGIRTARDLAAIDPLWMRKEFSTVQERLVRELNGERCLDLEDAPAPRKNIQVSRSFQEATNDERTISEAVATFAAKACEKARSEGTVASAVYVHLNTSWHKEDYVSDGQARGFETPTAHSPEVIRTALELFCGLYRPGSMYKKAAVMLLDLRDGGAVKSQGTLFELDGKTPEEKEKESRLMESVDQINRLMGKGKLFFGSEGTERNWRAASEHRSPNYTVDWKELPLAKAK